MNTAAAGNSRELRTAALLSAQGWLVASRRHIGGAGDLLAHKPGERPRLIEVKYGASGRFENFRPADREQMRSTAREFGCAAELCFWARGKSEPEWVPSSAWPN